MLHLTFEGWNLRRFVQIQQIVYALIISATKVLSITVLSNIYVHQDISFTAYHSGFVIWMMTFMSMFGSLRDCC